MPEMDQGIKWLVEHRPADILALALPGAEYLGTLTTDLAVPPQRVADALLHIRYQGVECALHLEAEAYPNEEIAARCLEYGARGFITTRLPVFSVVFWLQPGGTPPTSPYELRVGDRVIAHWYFTGIELYNIPAEQIFQAGLVGLLPLVPFTRERTNLAVIEQAAQLVQQQAPAEAVSDLESLLAVFGARTFGVEVMLALLRRTIMSTEILDTSPLYQMWKQEWLAEGEAKGETKGLAEATLTVLRARFGTISPALEAAVRSASATTLDDVLTHAISETLEQIAARLGVQP